MDFWGEFLGYLAGICTAVFFLPQSVQTIKTKDVSGLSFGSYVIYCIGMILWIAYGAYLHSIQMIFFNAVSLIFAAIILFMIVRQR
ncbi:MAG: SemiSWEET transporter [Alphaproteobacteria bacterium]|nr:SemiSWEET transporter [Alphaproteobacteria bacterium]